MRVRPFLIPVLSPFLAGLSTRQSVGRPLKQRFAADYRTSVTQGLTYFYFSR